MPIPPFVFAWHLDQVAALSSAAGTLCATALVTGWDRAERFARRHRRWLPPAVTGTLGLILMLFLFLRGQQTAPAPIAAPAPTARPIVPATLPPTPPRVAIATSIPQETSVRKSIAANWNDEISTVWTPPRTRHGHASPDEVYRVTWGDSPQEPTRTRDVAIARNVPRPAAPSQPPRLPSPQPDPVVVVPTIPREAPLPPADAVPTLAVRIERATIVRRTPRPSDSPTGQILVSATSQLPSEPPNGTAVKDESAAGWKIAETARWNLLAQPQPYVGTGIPASIEAVEARPVARVALGLPLGSPDPTTTPAPAASDATPPATNSAPDANSAPDDRPTPKRSLQLEVTRHLAADVAVHRLACCTITVRNPGPDPVASAELVEVLPEGALLAESRPAALVEGRTVRWTIGPVAPGATQTLAAWFVPGDPALTAVDTVLTVRPAAHVSATTRVSGPHVSLRLAAPPRVPTGAPVVLVFRVRNDGPRPLESVVVRHELSPGLSHAFGRQIDFDAGTLEPGQTREARLTVQAAHAGPAVHRAVVVIAGQVLSTEEQSVEVEPRATRPVRATQATPRSEPAPAPRPSIPRPPVSAAPRPALATAAPRAASDRHATSAPRAALPRPPVRSAPPGECVPGCVIEPDFFWP